MANFFTAKVKKPSSNSKKQCLNIRIDKLDMNGCGVGRFQNKPIFVEESLPTEKVEVLLIEQKNKFARGRLMKVLDASENRVKASCEHFSLCGGCNLQHLEYLQQLRFKQTKVIELLSRSGIDRKLLEHLPWQSPITSQAWHYRRKARIGVQFNKNAQPCVGFRQKATNQLVAIKSCPTLVKPLDNIFPILQQVISQLNVKKAIGHIEVIASHAAENNTDIITLVIRQLRKLTSDDQVIWEEYAQQHNWQLIFDFGKDSDEKYINHQVLSYPLTDDIKIKFSHSDFIQVNARVNKTMVQQAMSWLELEQGDFVLDLFCGLGNFSLPIAKKVRKVVGVEGVQAMVDKAQANASENGLANCQFYQADLNSDWLEQSWANQTYSKVVLDPARAGAELAVKQLTKLAIKTVLYISCDAATLARDSQLLIDQGYKIVKIALVDMFSQTKHVETMVLFSK